MKQQRYYAEHTDSQPPDPATSLHADPAAVTSKATTTGKFTSCRTSLPTFVQPGQHAGDQATLRFLEPRRLRRLDVEGPSLMALSVNGQRIHVVQPGENTFDPPIPIHAGDTLQLEALAQGNEITGDTLTGWNRSVSAETRGSSHSERRA
jgi:hypothetical protein